MKWASLGSGAAVLCAVHCLALPVLAGASCCVHDSPWSNPWMEGGMLGVTAAIGYSTLGSGYRRHGQPLPLVLLTLGIALLIGAHFKLSGAAATVTTILGALCAVGAQVANGRCPVSGCTDHDHRHEMDRTAMASRA